MKRTNSQAMTMLFKTVCARRLLPLVLLVLASVAQAQFTFSTNNGTLTVTGYTGSDSTVVIPSATNGLAVTSIGDYAFYYKSNLISVTIPNTVTSIGFSAFGGCSSLSSVVIPASVTNIENLAFSGNYETAPDGCPKLIAITADTNNPVYSSLDGVLFNKSQTKLLVYPGGKGGSYSVPRSVTTIGDWAFSSCRSLTRVAIPSNVINIGAGAFGDCTSLKDATLSPNVNSIGSLAFYRCTNLAHVVMGSKVAAVGYGAFYACKSLTRAYFTGSAPEMDAFVFDGAANGFAVYYFNGAAGFSSPTWMGYPTVNMGNFTPTADWLLLHGYSYNEDLQSDPNGDGVSLLTAYALNLDPRLNLSGSLPKPVNTGSQMSLTFYAGCEWVLYTVETSTDLKVWRTNGVNLSPLDANLCRTATIPIAGPCGFMRLGVTPLTSLIAEQEIRAFYAELRSRAETHDEAGFLALFAPDYIHEGHDLADAFDTPAFLDNIETCNFDITGITFTGNGAEVAGSFSLTFNDGEPSETWSEPDTADHGGIGWLRRTPAGWRIIGDQKRVSVRVQTAHITTPGDERYYFQLRTESSSPITTVTVSGPGIVPTELEPDFEWGGFNAFAGNFTSAGCPPVGTVYTFVVHFLDGSQEIYHDTVKAWVATGPVVSVTPEAGAATIHWTDVSAAVANADRYWVRVVGGDVYWQSDGLPLTETSIAFNADGTSTAPLVVGQSYQVWVFIFDGFEDYAFRTCEFTWSPL